MSTLERAIALAAVAHAGAKDKAGAPYILHPLRVMSRVQGEAQQMAAILHDVVEDTPITLEQLRELGFPADVVDAVGALTKRRDEKEDYFAFVERAGRHQVARSVKLADIEDNMDLSRIVAPTKKDHARVARYRRARKLLHLIGRENGETEQTAPTIMPLRGTITRAEVEAECPGDRPILACDFYVKGAEHGDDASGGIQLGRILNVDHHAPIARMEVPITSTQLAVEHLRQNRDAEPEPWVVINHTDCDSMLSSAMLMGYVEPTKELVAASVCADHTGEVNQIADLLQSLDEARHGDRTETQYLESLRNLKLLLRGNMLEEAAVDALKRRSEQRAEAGRLVEQGNVPCERGVAFARLDSEIDGAFFVALLPEAAVIMLASPHPKFADHWAIKLRLGKGAPPRCTLHALGISEWDPAFGGRWNAGSNKRDGGTAITPEMYAEHLRDHLTSFPEKLRVQTQSANRLQE